MNSQPIVWPHLRRFTTIIELKERAVELFPTSEKMQEKWVESIKYLRNVSRSRWVSDESIPTPQPPPTLRFADKK